jgi:hypothetical protein
MEHKENKDIDIAMNISPIPQIIKPDIHNSLMVVGGILRVILMILVGVIAWRCNIQESLIIRILITLFASIFCELYLVFYTIYRVILGNSCYNI